MSTESNQILTRLLERLYASLTHGPCLNCRVHRSRQRIDLTSLDALQDLLPTEILQPLLQENGSVELKAKAPPFRSTLEEAELTLEDKARFKAYETQAKLMAKLRDIAEDARDYEQETGENALYIGYPLVSVPPGMDMNQKGSLSSRVLAPLALIPVDVVVRRGAVQSITFKSKGEGVDLVIPNFPLLAWLEHQTGRDTSSLFQEEEARLPFEEINEIAEVIAQGLQLTQPPPFSPTQPLGAVPKAEQLPEGATFLNAAVLGLFPVSNQGLLRDLQAMVNGEDLQGPVEHFLKAEVTQPPPIHLEPEPDPRTAEPMPENQPPPIPDVAVAPHAPRQYDQERMVAQADPCQARAVRFAEKHPILVLHGPPGTGKSQTITNIISDHLARGERVLLVCDKRTAIDVVKNRLEHLGLGDLCAVVYDPQRDQRSLYMKIRDQLESLADIKTRSRAESGLRKTDGELLDLHRELQGYFKALNQSATPEQASFHDWVGEWLELTPAFSLPENSLVQAGLKDLEDHEPLIHEVLQRAQSVTYASNPWVQAAGLALSTFLSQPAAMFRQSLLQHQGEASQVDATMASHPLFLAHDLPLLQQAQARETLATQVQSIHALPIQDQAKAWFEKPPATITQLLGQLDALQPNRTTIQGHPLDAELRLNLGDALPAVAQLNQDITALGNYLESAGKLFGFLAFGKKSAGQKVLTRFGLALDRTNAERVRTFLEGMKARLICQDFLNRQAGTNPSPTGSALPTDSDLLTHLKSWDDLFQALQKIHQDPALSNLHPQIAVALGEPPQPFIDQLINSARRARLADAFLQDLQEQDLFAPEWLNQQRRELAENQPAAPVFEKLVATLDTLESVLRLRESQARVPAPLQAAVQSLIQENALPEDGLCTIRKHLLAREISHRIQHDPTLQQVDQDRLQSCFQRYNHLEKKKREQVRDAILHRWISQQQDRLLAQTRTQLNGAGAALKRRLITRGKRSMKLRQMILHGASQKESDPLFDVCPVWMASPSTVAQIFARKPIFDVLIFDEASQCRLEEAIPVLTRGNRVVIAGDPKQLPPTRFFEAAFVETDPEEATNDQDLFELQQAETEDLLGAALNIQVQQSYLDVHYRSRNESLIGFSNRNFYHNRLQPIPGHPSLKGLTPPIELVRVDGCYEKRCNLKEAEAVVKIIKDLLAKPKPPSVGIACFNMVQRDLVLDKLEQAVEEDATFAACYETARARRGEGSFEGLFVKNLENVQGDERDHIIICTTFGPDGQGKFRRNFGPVGRQGGGRRLNVLVTRAREKIHLVTSIPRSEYATLPDIEAGQSPSGRWLLYAYLHYSEDLAAHYLKETKRLEAEKQSQEPSGTVNVHDTRNHSSLARQLAEQLAQFHGQSSEVFWGNEGFCVDIALHHPSEPEQVTIGVLCDMNRFQDTQDPVEWELFRTAILEHNGWKFHRIWSPGLFLDPEKHRRAIIEAARP